MQVVTENFKRCIKTPEKMKKYTFYLDRYGYPVEVCPEGQQPTTDINPLHCKEFQCKDKEEVDALWDSLEDVARWRNS